MHALPSMHQDCKLESRMSVLLSC